MTRSQILEGSSKHVGMRNRTTPNPEIFLLHGCAPSVIDRQVDRNYVSEQSLTRHLQELSRPYGPLSPSREGIALTVDDATVGACRACILAREAGHEVTLFVNPAQVLSARTYWFSRLDAILDARRVSIVKIESRIFDLSSRVDMRQFRLHLKADLTKLPENKTDSFLENVEELLNVSDPVVPEHASTSDIGMLLNLLDRGVRIESHGWDHREIASMSSEEVASDLGRTKQWLKACLGIQTSHYAVPYGHSSVGELAGRMVDGMILQSNPQLHAAELAPKHWNRVDITSRLRDQQ